MDGLSGPAGTWPRQNVQRTCDAVERLESRNMCGIAGLVNCPDDDRLSVMTDAVAHRGRDDRGVRYFPEERVGLGHRRLSIIDLSPAGHQPMANDDETIWIVFNGEIYNFIELRAEL